MTHDEACRPETTTTTSNHGRLRLSAYIMFVTYTAYRRHAFFVQSKDPSVRRSRAPDVRDASPFPRDGRRRRRRGPHVARDPNLTARIVFQCFPLAVSTSVPRRPAARSDRFSRFRSFGPVPSATSPRPRRTRGFSRPASRRRRRHRDFAVHARRRRRAAEASWTVRRRTTGSAPPSRSRYAGVPRVTVRGPPDSRRGIAELPPTVSVLAAWASFSRRQR